ncbi:nodulation protein NodH [Thalassobius sp. Cn5-15]|uniref:nodulation protein NodH n=1 Tax=Thalassobius sp. Cn5-15 TaxID=2917763 RepID=UPI001EF19CC5|nr:nodulation protein NodH [Thalassobius sp. Cn5-15]MCG7494004.1 nodulation protein NodH [Thalassobius sp. Cn5-15]
MSDRFDYFVVFAEMRTGSNFLEANLNAFPSLTCHGEAFNPHFIGYPNKTEILGVTQDMRDDDPQRLLDTIRQHSDGMGGFRYFHDHDPRILDAMLDDPRCAKIVLTRNPVESYVSWKIAQATGQWKLTNETKRRDSKAVFDKAEFETHLADLQAFQVMLLNRLQAAGQTAFYVAYEDLQDLDVTNGLARWLGQEDQLEELDGKLKKQNPAPLSQKVENYPEMEAALSHLDQFNLTRTPNFEPRRGAVVPSYVAAKDASLLFMPLRNGCDDAVRRWMAALDDVGAGQLQDGFSQKTLRMWKKDHAGFRSFSVLRHPVARVHDAFCSRILATGRGTYPKIRKTLNRRFDLGLPDEVDAQYDAQAHRAAFLGFLDFLKMNMAGQTAIRVDATWCSQSQTLQGFADIAQPDMILREDELADMLPVLAAAAGRLEAPEYARPPEMSPIGLEAIYNADLEARVAAIYQKDYVSFGFTSWA